MKNKHSLKMANSIMRIYSQDSIRIKVKEEVNIDKIFIGSNLGLFKI